MKPEKPMNTREVMEHLGIRSLTTFYRHRRTGLIPPGIAMGTKRMWLPSELQAHLKKLSEQARQ